MRHESALSALSLLADESANTGGRYASDLQRHPCFEPAAAGSHARIHLPVAPTCNILCRFCDRRLSASGDRPALTRKVLGPEEAPAIVARAQRLCPQLSVVGVAGPGDALATPHALDALGRVRAQFPDLIGCLSTNGLRLADNVAKIVAVGVRAVTVTINALDPDVLVELCGGIVDDHRVIRRHEGARLLVAAQRTGLAAAVAGGLTVKVNAVLVPGVNDGHLGDIAREASALGASTMNVIPLIPQAELCDSPAPTCAEVDAAHRAVERHLPAMRHCRHCRADACGKLGGVDFGAALCGENAASSETFSHG